jgi:hypothetical protein
MPFNPPKTPTKIPPDITSPILTSTLQKGQDKKSSITNLNTILNIIEIELQYEQDYTILQILSQQKETFKKIVNQKQTGEKVHFKLAEDQNISQLQNQVEKLGKTVENKFNWIVKTLEAKELQSQAPKQAITYAQAAAKGLQTKESNTQTTSQKISQKQQEKQLQKEKLRQKRLIIKVAEIAENFDSYTLRNQINDRFFSKENITQPVIATVTKSLTSQSIILTTMPEFSADFLLQKKTVWEDIFSDKAQKIEKDTY